MSVRSNIGTIATNEDLNSVNTQLSSQITTINNNITAINTRIDNLPTGGGGANKYTHPSYTAKTSGLYKITVDATGHVSAATAVTKADITNLGIPAQDTTYSAATTSVAGLMSAADKTKLDGVTTGANKYTHPSYTAKTSGLYKITVDATGHVSAATAVTKADITAIGIPAYNTEYNDATTTTHGLMSTTDKIKLNNVLNLYTGTTEPSNTMGNDGDIYLMISTEE